MWSLLDKKYVIYCNMYLKVYTIIWKICTSNVILDQNQFLSDFCAHMQHNVIQFAVKFLLETQTEGKMILGWN